MARLAETRVFGRHGAGRDIVGGDIRYNIDQITKTTEQALNKLKFKPLKDTRKQWIGNIEKLGSLDMTALGPAMVAGYVIMKGRGGRIILANLDQHIEDLLTITRLARVFEIGPTLPEALAKLGV